MRRTAEAGQRWALALIVIAATPAIAQSNRDAALIEQLLSALFIESVVSSTIITLNGAADPPRAVAVAVAPIVRDLTPKILAKNVGTVACCFTVIAFMFAGGRHGMPTEVRHFNCGYPEAIDTFERFERAFKFPETALYFVAVVVAVEFGKSSAPASAAASVAA